MEISRDFKGIWIPREIWLNNNMTLHEKVFLAEIDSLDGGRGCFASNEYFGKFFNISTRRVQQVIKSMLKKNMVKVKFSWDKGGTNRLMFLSFKTTPPEENFTPPPETSFTPHAKEISPIEQRKRTKKEEIYMMTETITHSTLRKRFHDLYDELHGGHLYWNAKEAKAVKNILDASKGDGKLIETKMFLLASQIMTAKNDFEKSLRMTPCTLYSRWNYLVESKGSVAHIGDYWDNKERANADSKKP